MPVSDEDLMARVGAGDRDAFAEIVRRFEAKARRYAYRFFRDMGVAEDIAQETFLRIHRSAERYRPSGRFQTYLYRIAANLCYDRLRMLKRRGSSVQNTVDNFHLDRVEDCPSSRFAPPERGAELAEEKTMVREAIGRLPPGLAQILVLREFEGLKYREIGEVLSIPVNEVKVKLHGARKRLQRELRSILL